MKPWLYNPFVIAASGPSLTAELADQCRAAHEAGTHTIIAVSDAYKLLPFADILYAADIAWWTVHRGCPDFSGEKWIARQVGIPPFDQFGLKNILVRHLPHLSWDSSELHGFTSGFQAFNLALLKGANPVILIGYDMRVVANRRHFFGDHPKPLDNSSPFECWVPNFDLAAKTMPKGIRVLNATPDSAIKCFEMMPLAEALTL